MTTRLSRFEGCATSVAFTAREKGLMNVLCHQPCNACWCTDSDQDYLTALRFDSYVLGTAKHAPQECPGRQPVAYIKVVCYCMQPPLQPRHVITLPTPGVGTTKRRAPGNACCAVRGASIARNEGIRSPASCTARHGAASSCRRCRASPARRPIPPLRRCSSAVQRGATDDGFRELERRPWVHLRTITAKVILP